MRYSEDNQIFVKIFEEFLNFFRVLSEFSRDSWWFFREWFLSLNMSFLSHKQNGLITQNIYQNSNSDSTLTLLLALTLSLSLILTLFLFYTLFITLFITLFTALFLTLFLTLFLSFVQLIPSPFLYHNPFSYPYNNTLSFKTILLMW
jgi:hypothetical protein